MDVTNGGGSTDPAHVPDQAGTSELLKINAALQSEIAERKRVEEALHKSREEFRALAENSPDLIARFDRNVRHLYVNPVAARANVLSPEEYIGKTIAESGVPEPYCSYWTTRIRSVFESGQPVDEETAFPTPEGMRYFHTRLVPELDTSGSVGTVLSVASDITERKRAEAALRENEERYRALFNSMTEGFALHEIICDENGEPRDYRFLDINPAFERLTGLRCEDVVGRTYNEVLPDNDPRWIKAYGVVALTGVPVQFEDYSPALKRHYAVFAYRTAPRQFAVVFMDITGHKSMEEALRVNLTKYSVLFDSFPLGITVSDEGGQILETNKEAVRLLGVSEAEHTQRHIDGAQWQIIRPDGLPMPPEEYASVRALKEQRRVENVEMGIVKGDGQVTWISVTAAPLPLEGYGVVVTYGDITERRRAEEALRWQMHLTAALEERQRLARELHDSVSQALYGIALGTKTARSLLGRDPDQAAEPLDFIMSLAEEALSDMRALIFDLRPEMLESEGLVTALTKRASFIENRQGIRTALELCVEPDVPLHVKEGLYSIAREALYNAVKHARPTRVSIRLAREAEWLVLEVRDDGVGFDPAGEFPGHLGLQSMRERAAHLGGMLDIESAAGSGTRVHARVPAGPDMV